MKLGKSLVENTFEFLKSFPLYRKVINRNDNGDVIEGKELLTYEEACQPLSGVTPDAFMALGNPTAPFNYTDRFDSIDRLSQAIDSINYNTSNGDEE